MRFSRGGSPIYFIVVAVVTLGIINLLNTKPTFSPLPQITVLLLGVGAINMTIHKTQTPFWVVVLFIYFISVVNTLQKIMNEEHGV